MAKKVKGEKEKVVRKSALKRQKASSDLAKVMMKSEKGVSQGRKGMDKTEAANILAGSASQRAEGQAEGEGGQKAKDG